MGLNLFWVTWPIRSAESENSFHMIFFTWFLIVSAWLFFLAATLRSETHYRFTLASVFFMEMINAIIANELFELKLEKYSKNLKKRRLYTKFLFLAIYFANEGWSKLKISTVLVPNKIILKLVFLENFLFTSVEWK